MTAAFSPDNAHSQLEAIRELHDRWGDTDADDVDPTALWEELHRILNGAEA